MDHRHLAAVAHLPPQMYPTLYEPWRGSVQLMRSNSEVFWTSRWLVPMNCFHHWSLSQVESHSDLRSPVLHYCQRPRGRRRPVLVFNFADVWIPLHSTLRK